MRVRVAQVVFVLFCLGCSKSPAQVYEAIEEAARQGRAEEFASYFTEESRPVALALLSLYASAAPAEGPEPAPLSLLSRSTVESESIEGDRAYLTVKAPGEQGGQTYVIVFKKEGRAWKLDVVETEKKNATIE